MKKVWFSIGFLLGILSALANTHQVCATCVHASFQQAYEVSAEGDTILIMEGEYSVENIEIDKAITLIGKQGATFVAASGGEILTIVSDGVTIDGLTFTGVETNYLKENAGIRIRRSKEFRIANCRFDQCFFAIYLERARNGEVEGNRIMGDAVREADSGNGIHAWYCDSLMIVDNTITGHRDGVYFEFVDNSLISDNYSYSNIRYGLHFMFSNDDQYFRNRFENNGVGVAVMFSRRIEMKENDFHKNWGNAAYGLLLKEIYDAEIIDNTFSENSVAIFVEGSNRIQYDRNDFIRNGWAIKFSGGCEENNIVNNNFLYNSLDMLVSAQLYNNTVENNYWSAYSGYDLDKDGLGDVPYYPVSLFSYVMNQVPESVILLRSLFVDIVNFAEKVSPVFTPRDVFDPAPKMSRVL